MFVVKRVKRLLGSFGFMANNWMQEKEFTSEVDQSEKILDIE